MAKFGQRMLTWIRKKLHSFALEALHVPYLILGDIFSAIINLCGDGNRTSRSKGVMYFRLHRKFLPLNSSASKIFKSLSPLARN